MNKVVWAMLAAMGVATVGGSAVAGAAEPPPPPKAGPIVVDTAAAWTHPPTGIVIPPAIGAFTRTSVSQSDHGLADVSIGYDDNTTRTTLTIYIFRAGWPQAPLWADRLSQVMGMTVQRMGGTLAGTPVFTPFTPTGHASASGMRVVQSAQGGALQATGAVVIPAGNWLVTMRMSSPKFDAAALDAQLAATAAALYVPVPAKPLPAAEPIAPCADALSIKPAKRLNGDDSRASVMMNALLGAALSNAVANADKDDGEKDASPDYADTLCRDPGATPDRALYRRPGDTQHYIIALGDAGVTLEAGPNVLAALKKKPDNFDLHLILFDKILFYQPFKSLPTPEQAMDALNHEQPQGTSSGTDNVTISL
ncbi:MULTISPECIES: hypothetical protein [unclassified Novosphingobium]|uniref:hypothetical protein n=1 Tax=unclassified Novosphingobium TaxID=2644732 RepID=UPI00146C4059|nr:MULTISPECIES: hypothetical protein [unclassified Novosphingobium]NMN03948.1 hypothetical protein [Novosphingobium sp. SG919]NMN86062.1 hypothetical protein [Novosphingobium sp. SG916]